MISARALFRSAGLLLLCLGVREKASATTLTQTGLFTADNQVAELSFTAPTASTYTLYTTSFGGGMNLNGTPAIAGGFVPVLSLFQADGTIVAADGGSGMCHGGAMPSGSPGMCDDAYLQVALMSGNYILALTEFPNVANGNLSDGFLFASDPHATGTVCSQSGGTFLESDVSPCSQRNGSYAVNVTNTSAVPEPPTWALVLPAAGMLFFAGRQHLS
jgi:hypothetical protein